MEIESHVYRSMEVETSIQSQVILGMAWIEGRALILSGRAFFHALIVAFPNNPDKINALHSLIVALPNNPDIFM